MDNYNKAIDDMIAHFRTQLKGSITQGEVYLEQIRTMLQAAEQDRKMLDWLDKNIHVVPMSDFDMKCAPNSNEWGIYAPKEENGELVYGSARAIVGAAMRRDEE